MNVSDLDPIKADNLRLAISESIRHSKRGLSMSDFEIWHETERAMTNYSVAMTQQEKLRESWKQLKELSHA